MGSVAKAIAAGFGAAATYFGGVLLTIEGGAGSFSDLSTVQWLGAIPAILLVYGIVWLTPNTGESAPPASAAK